MDCLECPSCGNAKRFYRDISIVAKLRVSPKGEDMKAVFDVKKSVFDGWYEPIYCCDCGTQVGE